MPSAPMRSAIAACPQERSVPRWPNRGSNGTVRRAVIHRPRRAQAALIAWNMPRTPHFVHSSAGRDSGLAGPEEDESSRPGTMRLAAEGVGDRLVRLTGVEHAIEHPQVV